MEDDVVFKRNAARKRLQMRRDERGLGRISLKQRLGELDEASQGREKLQKYGTDKQISMGYAGGDDSTKPKSNLPSSLTFTANETSLDRYVAPATTTHAEARRVMIQAAMGRESADLNDSESSNGPIVSPFSGRMLKPFIWRDPSNMPPFARVINEMKNHLSSKNDTITPKLTTIDYSYVRPRHIAGVNGLLEDTFWKGIDMSECLVYPEHSVVATYGQRIVGCGFITPEGYVSFIATHTNWTGHGIGTFMLYHLIQTCPNRDITLHVSATNPAMSMRALLNGGGSRLTARMETVLYQRFGFKPEQYALNFYDRYLPEESQHCKHAFFMRLRR